jgi:crotonobetainyl-CoA:carnitine CoA-transferase CaiB-like acyl-CoA transferase
MAAMLDGTLTVELGGTRAAAYAGKLLADAGSEVIALQDANRETNLPAAAKIYMDTAKTVVTWREEGDPVLVEKLLPQADLLVTDLDSQQLARRGLAWKSLHSRFPRLTFVHLLPVGPVGDGRTSSGGELAMQAISGVMHMVGDPKREPLALPYSLGSIQLGVNGAAAAAAALRAAADTGTGRLVEISGAEVMASYVRIYGAVATYYRVLLRRDGRRAPGSGGRWPFGIFPCRDGWVAMICRSAREWESLLAMMGHPAWSAQERYRDMHAMAIEYPEEVDELVRPWLLQRTRDELLKLAQQFAVPVAPVRSVNEVLTDPQLRDYRNFFDHVITVSGEVVNVPGRPWASSPRVLAERGAGVADALGRARVTWSEADSPMRQGS